MCDQAAVNRQEETPRPRRRQTESYLHNIKGLCQATLQSWDRDQQCFTQIGMNHDSTHQPGLQIYAALLTLLFASHALIAIAV